MSGLSGMLAGAIAAAMLVAGSGTALAQTPVQAQAGQMAGRHSVEGEVTRVDAKKGWIHLKTADGTMIMHFPPTDLQAVKKGDRMTVSLALKDNGPAPK